MGISYIVRTSGGQALTVLCTRPAERFEVDDPVELAWLPASALVLAPTEEAQQVEAKTETRAHEEQA